MVTYALTYLGRVNDHLGRFSYLGDSEGERAFQDLGYRRRQIVMALVGVPEALAWSPSVFEVVGRLCRCGKTANGFAGQAASCTCSLHRQDRAETVRRRTSRLWLLRQDREAV